MEINAPTRTLASGVDVIDNIEGSWIRDENKTGYVFINQDMDLARDVRQYLLTGSINDALSLGFWSLI